MKPIKIFALSIGLISLASCQTWDGLKQDVNSLNTPEWTKNFSGGEPDADDFVIGGDCPKVEVVEELGSINEFSDLSDPQPYNLITQAHISRVTTTCEYSGKTATADVQITFEGKRGARAQDVQFDYPFFVAVTNPGGKILAKELFTADVAYSGADMTTTQESVRQIIPIANKNEGAEYKILVGFQLDQSQLAYNRALIASRLAAEKAAIEAAKAAKTAPQATPPQEVVIIETPTYQQPELMAPAPQESGPIVIAPQ